MAWGNWHIWPYVCLSMSSQTSLALREDTVHFYLVQSYTCFPKIRMKHFLGHLDSYIFEWKSANKTLKIFRGWSLRPRPTHRHILQYQNTFINSACPTQPPLSEEGMHLHKAPLPPYRRTRTVTKSIRFRINLQYAQNGSLLTKIVDPSLDTSLKVFISVPTRSFGRPS